MELIDYMVQYLISFGAAMFFAMAATFLYEGEFNMHVFLLGLSVSLAVLVWANAIPFYFMLVIALLLAAIVLTDGNGGD